MRHQESAVPETEINMQQTRRTSFLKSLFTPRKAQTIEPRKPVQPLDERQAARVAGGVGETSLPRGGW
jgi:hypothetical protein